MKWSWKPRWMRLPDKENNGNKKHAENVQATVSKLQAQQKLRDTIAERKVVQEIVKETRELSDKFGEAIEQAMRRAANG